MCGTGSGLRTQADDLSTGPLFVQPQLLGIGWNDQFPNAFPRGPAALMHRYRESSKQVAVNDAPTCGAAKNWPYSSAHVCNLCIPSQAQILRDNPTSSLTKAAGVVMLWIMREKSREEVLGNVGVGWRQLRSEPRGKQKPKRRNCDGKLTGEAGPALGNAGIHLGYVVGGLVIECGLVVLRNAIYQSVWLYVGGEGSFQLSGWGVAKCFGIGEILRRAQNREGGVTLGCGVIFTDQSGI